jgi:cytochrome c-type biogenesis protein CcmH
MSQSRGFSGISRRAFVERAAGAAAVLVGVTSRAAHAVQQPQSAPMAQDAYIPVRRPPRPGATPKVSTKERDSLEALLKCGCGGCPLDVYTCRTTDFACRVSPRMHADVEELIAGGYDSSEIMTAFVETWGDRVRTAPRAEGFNLLAYVAPYAGLGVGGLIAAWLIRRWMRGGPRDADPTPQIPQVAATDDEMARLEAAVRDDR